MSMTDVPIESDFVVLVPAGVSVATDEFSATGDIDIAATYGDLPRTRQVSGKIVSLLLVAYAGLGFTPDEPGIVFFFDADPNTTAGDVALTAVIRGTEIAQVEILAADWDATATNGSAYKEVDIDFHAVDTLYAVFRNLGNEINDGIKDTEQLDLKIWYRRDD